MKNILILAICSGLLLSCVSFDNSMYNKNITKINKNNYEIFNGKYENSPFEEIHTKDLKKELPIWNNVCIKDYVVINTNSYLPNCNPAKKPELSIIKEGKEYFLVLAYENCKEEISEYKIKGVFKRGFFKLDNYSFIPHNIPYILGGAKVTQSRVGLDTDKNLIIEDYTDNSGAFMFFFWAGHSGSSGLKFKRAK